MVTRTAARLALSARVAITPSHQACMSGPSDTSKVPTRSISVARRTFEVPTRSIRDARRTFKVPDRSVGVKDRHFRSAKSVYQGRAAHDESANSVYRGRSAHDEGANSVSRGRPAHFESARRDARARRTALARGYRPRVRKKLRRSAVCRWVPRALAPLDVRTLGVMAVRPRSQKG